MNVLNLSISRVRRNHALEHATIHMLAEKNLSLTVVGRSTLNGFHLYGNLTTEMVAQAAREALRRLRAGEHHLAIHPNCGTNLVASGSVAGLAVFALMGGRKERRLDMLPGALLAATLGLLVARPLGPLLQARVTTMADLGDLTIKDIRREDRRNLVAHFVETG